MAYPSRTKEFGPHFPLGHGTPSHAPKKLPKILRPASTSARKDLTGARGLLRGMAPDRPTAEAPEVDRSATALLLHRPDPTSC